LVPFYENKVIVTSLPLLDPLLALVISFAVLAIMLYRRFSIGVTLVTCAVVMSLLSIAPSNIIGVFINTTKDTITISLVLVTFGIGLLSLLYKETGTLDKLSGSVEELLRNPKLVVSTLPAILGLLPVPGGALMSAPLVDSAAEKLELDNSKKAYVNVWFRHIIFPIYPMGQVILLTAALTNTSISSIIISQIPVVAIMTIVGYLIGLRRTAIVGSMAEDRNLGRNLWKFTVSFLPILAMIFIVAFFKIDVAIAAFIGIFLLLLLSRPAKKTLIKVVTDISIYKVALAAYGAMLLRGVTGESGISESFGQMFAATNVGEVVLLSVLPIVLGFLVGLPSGSIAISAPIIAGVITFSSRSASLLYISAYLGYLAAPTHLCLALTISFFKSSLGKVYKFLVPSVIISFAAALLVYFFS
jgi:integral membrane protein (TIGR00529 family)